MSPFRFKRRWIACSRLGVHYWRYVLFITELYFLSRGEPVSTEMIFGIYDNHHILDEIGSRKSRHAMRHTLKGWFVEVNDPLMLLLLGRLNSYRTITSMTPIAKNFPDIWRHSNDSLYGPMQVIYVIEFFIYFYVIMFVSMCCCECLHKVCGLFALSRWWVQNGVVLIYSWRLHDILHCCATSKLRW